jgi:hypothetical protein
MGEVTPLPTRGTVFFDARDDGRTLRVSFHPEQAVYVISVWRADTCLGTFRLLAEHAADFVHAITEPLAEPYADADGQSSTGA